MKEKRAFHKDNILNFHKKMETLEAKKEEAAKSKFIFYANISLTKCYIVTLYTICRYVSKNYITKK